MSLTAEGIVKAGLVTPERLDEIRRVAEQFSVAVTDDMAALIDPSDPSDPIAAQFVPNAAELETAAEELADPIGDGRWSPVPGIVHRYPDRVLLKPILLCPVYCRFCFRRETVGKTADMLDPAALERACDYVRQRPEIWEVIVTGGDPFILATAPPHRDRRRARQYTASRRYPISHSGSDRRPPPRYGATGLGIGGR